MKRPKLLLVEEPPKLERLVRSGSLTEDMIIKFCDLIREGMPADAVCDFLCIGHTSFYAWLRKGELAMEMDNPSPKEQLFTQFYLHFRKAFAEYRAVQSVHLHTAPGNGWIRHLAILERRDRKSFGRREMAGGGDESYDSNDKFL